MSEPKWTPGPWRKKQGAIVDAHGKTVRVHGFALPCGYTPDSDPSYANTDLALAAPDLYEACTQAKKYLEPDLVEPGRTVFWNLVAALAKARGESAMEAK